MIRNVLKCQLNNYQSLQRNKASIASTARVRQRRLLSDRLIGASSTFQHSSQLNTSAVHRKDYYKTLGLDKNASQKDIKKAYFQLAKKYHPDVNKNDDNAAKKFSEAAEAYEYLGDEQKRQQYDTFGTAGQNMGGGAGGFNPFQGGGNPFQSAGNPFGGGQSIDPEELFRSIFGDFNKSARSGGEEDSDGGIFGQGPSKQLNISLSFAEAARGMSKDLKLKVVDTCPTCNGAKTKGGAKMTRCHYCNGTGTERIQNGAFLFQQTCRYCQGTRQLNPDPCGGCRGKGRKVMPKTVTVQIPAGIDDGQTLRINVGGEEIFVTVAVQASRYFTREGNDVHTDVTISVAQAVLGGTLRVQGVYDDLNLDIPAGTNSHSTLTLGGKGLKKVNNFGHGNHIVHLKIRTPNKLSEDENALFMVLAEVNKDTENGTIDGMIQRDDGGFQSAVFSEKVLLLKAVLDGSIEQLLAHKFFSPQDNASKQTDNKKKQTVVNTETTADSKTDTKAKPDIKEDTKRTSG